MTDLLVFAVLFAFLAIVCVYRLVKGPTAADRMVAGDNADIIAVGRYLDRKGRFNNADSNHH